MVRTKSYIQNTTTHVVNASAIAVNLKNQRTGLKVEPKLSPVYTETSIFLFFHV